MEKQYIYNRLNDRIYDVECVQIDCLSVYKENDMYKGEVILKNFSKEDVNAVHVLINGFDQDQNNILKELGITTNGVENITFDIEDRNVVSISCSIIWVELEDSMIEYKDIDVYYLNRYRMLKRKYTPAQLRAIKNACEFPLNIQNESRIPYHKGLYGIDLNGDLVLYSENEEFFQFFDEMTTESMELMTKLLNYKKACSLYESDQSSDLVRAIQMFESDLEFKDSKEWHEKCKTKLQEIYAINKQKQKKMFIIIASFLVLLFGGMKYYNVQASKPLLIVRDVQFELGQPVVLNLEDFYDADMSRNVDNYDFVLESDLMSDDSRFVYDPLERTVTSKDMEYLQAGEYTVTVTSKKHEIKNTTTLTVTDTTAPAVEVRKIKYQVGGNKIPFERYIKVDDLSDTTIEVDDSQVNLNEKGTYTCKVSVTDSYGNKTEEEFKVHIMKLKKVFFAGMYKSNTDLKVYSDLAHTNVVGVIPADSEIAINQYIEAEDGSYWGLLTSGLVCMSDKNDDYVAKIGEIKDLRIHFSSDTEFKTACHIKEDACNVDLSKVGNLTYTQSCSSCVVFY